MSSTIAGDIKQVSGGLFNSESLEKLVLWNVTGITDEDMTHLSNVLVSNTTLKELHLFICNITVNGVQYICEGLNKNLSLAKLDIGHNHRA